MTKVGVLIGRFQPLHDGHKELIKQALASSNILIILVGSANRARTIKNPWSYIERREAIEDWVWNKTDDEPDLDHPSKIIIQPLNDYSYDDSQWISDVQETVDRTIQSQLEPENCIVTLFGHRKDDTNYLDWFPTWRNVMIHTSVLVSGTITREWLLENEPTRMPSSVLDDYKYFQKEKDTFGGYPYPQTLSFSCGDVILECAGHILLIKRKFAPGKNTWALPGGFKNRNETFIDCAIRELLEETNVRVPEKVLRGSIQETRLFDSPTRGSGIPRVTLAVHITIEPDRDGNLPRANGADDAMECKWIPISTIMNKYRLFDDHQDIIMAMTGAKPIPAYINENINSIS